MGELCSQRIKRLLSLRSHAVRLAVYKARHKGFHTPKLEHVVFSWTWFNRLVF